MVGNMINKSSSVLIKVGGSINTLKMDYYKPNEKTLVEMCNVVPPHGISSNQWIKLVKYCDSKKGKNLSACGKEARASQIDFLLSSQWLHCSRVFISWPILYKIRCI